MTTEALLNKIADLLADEYPAVTVDEVTENMRGGYYCVVTLKGEQYELNLTRF